MESNSIDITKRVLGNNTRRPDLTFYRNGRIDISSRVSKLLDLQPGDVIDVALAKGGEYYLYVRSKGRTLMGRQEAQCFPPNKGKARFSFRAYSKKLTDFVLAKAGGDKAQIIAGEYREYENIGKSLCIIPSLNLYKR